MPGCTVIVILLPWVSHRSGNFCFFEILAFNAFILEKWSCCQWQCLIQCISYTVVNCIYKNYTMLLSPSFNSIYKIWHAKMILIQLTKYPATFKISFNFVKYIMQLSKYHATQEGCIFFGNMYNELRKEMGVVTRPCTFSGEGRW